MRVFERNATRCSMHSLSVITILSLYYRTTMHRYGHDDARACRSVAPSTWDAGISASLARGLCPLECEAILQQDAEKEAPPDELG